METQCGTDKLSPSFLEAVANWETPDRCKTCERNIDKFPALTALLGSDRRIEVADMLCGDCEVERFAWDGNQAFMLSVGGRGKAGSKL